MTGWLQTLRDTALLMVGQPSYDAYLKHMARRHPDQQPMTRTEFFRDRQQARYGGRGGGRCCRSRHDARVKRPSVIPTKVGFSIIHHR